MQIGIWVAVAIGVVKGMESLVRLGHRLWGKPQKPPNRQLEASLETLDRKIEAEQREFEKHVEWNRREHENLFSKIGGVERGSLARMDSISREWRSFVEGSMAELIKSNNEGRSKLHDRINTILAEVSEIRGELKGRHK